ncbi:MAG TPA: tetratricopeptide repeat protein, partial [Tepidiformaceae bacterium]|nr:tetratricopeptide repeat protein [Tepidiformaceae bacterium]
MPPLDLPASEAVQAANRLLREGRFELARATFEQLADRSTDAAEQAEAWFGAGSAAHEAGDVPSSLAAFRQAFELAPAGSSLSARAGYMLARRLNDAEQYAEAVEVARATQATPVLEGYVRNELARALAGSGDGDGANREWDAVLGLASTTAAARAEIYRSRIAIAREAGNDVALAAALDGLIAVTGDAEARFQRAMLARDAGAMNVFESQLQAIITNSPSSTFAVRAIVELRAEGRTIDPGRGGSVYYRRSAYPGARRVLPPPLEDASAPAADIPFRAYYLAASYEDSGDYANAIRYYDMAAGTGAGTPFIHRARYWAARSAEAAGDATTASARYVALVREGPTGEFSAESAFRAGFVLLNRGSLDAALAAWDAAGTANSARLEYWRGRALEDAGNQSAANAAFERAIALGPYDFHGLEAAVRLGRREGVSSTPFVERDLFQPVDWDVIASWLRGRVGGDWPGTTPTAA